MALFDMQLSLRSALHYSSVVQGTLQANVLLLSAVRRSRMMLLNVTLTDFCRAHENIIFVFHKHATLRRSISKHELFKCVRVQLQRTL